MNFEFKNISECLFDYTTTCPPGWVSYSAWEDETGELHILKKSAEPKSGWKLIHDDFMMISLGLQLDAQLKVCIEALKGVAETGDFPAGNIATEALKQMGINE